MTRRKKKPSYDYWSQLKRGTMKDKPKNEAPRYRIAKREGEWVVLLRAQVQVRCAYYLSCWRWIERREALRTRRFM